MNLCSSSDSDEIPSLQVFADQESPCHHPIYYFDDDMAIFVVQNRLFKVHRHFLIRESAIFEWMFLCPPRQEGPEGGTDDKAIPLPGITCREFESLLNFFYNGMHHREVSIDEWLDLLSISTRYDFERVRQHAINMIDSREPGSLNTVEVILLAQKFNIPQWLVPAYSDLCQRVNPIEVWEAEKLGSRTTALLARAREALRDLERDDDRPPSPSTPEIPDAMSFVETIAPLYSIRQVARIVNEVFFPAPSSP